MNVTLAGSLLTYRPNDDQLTSVSLELAAFDGQIGNGILPVPDQAAALTVVTGRAALVEEGATVLSDGFMLDQERERGPVLAGTARVYQFGIMDANALLDGFRVQRSRPSETDVARVLAFAALDGPAWDTAMVLVASTVTMPAKRYDSDGGWGEFITDLVEFTGKTLFLHDKADGSGRCLHYHVLTSGHTSGLTVSDVIGAFDGVTTFAPIGPQRTRTSVDLRNDIKGRDQAGRVYHYTDPTSIAAHDADGLQHQALIDFEANSLADLTAKTTAYGASLKDDRDTWTFAIGPLDEAALAEIRVGDLIPVTSSVMGLTASTQRIAHMTLSPTIGEGGRAGAGWMAALEVGAPIRRRKGIKPAIVTANVIIRTNPPVSVTPDGDAEICTPVTELADGAFPVWHGGNFDSVTGTITWPPCAPDTSLISCPLTGTSITVIQDTGGTSGENNGALAKITSTQFDGDGRFRGRVAFEGLTANQVTEFRFAAPRTGEVSIGSNIDITRHVTGTYLGEAPGTYIRVAGSGGAGTTSAFFDLDLDPGTAFVILWKFEMPTGTTTFRGKAWVDGTEEPDWQVTATRTIGPPVLIEIYVNAYNSASMTTTFDEMYWCTDFAGPVAYAGEIYGPVLVATASGSTSTFNLPWYPGAGYVPGSVTAYVDGTMQPVVTETDPVGPPGTFDLGPDPDAGDKVYASWRVPL